MAETESKTEPSKPLLWGPKHDIFYANAFHLRVSDNDISIELGTTQNINGVEGILSTHQLIMTYKSAKLLSIVLSQTINQVEGRFGEIKIDAEKIATIQAAMAEGSKKISRK
jgi:hypothetical protein